MKLCSIYSDVSDKVKRVIFAKKIAEAEAEAAAAAEARKKTITIVCICVGVAVLAAAIAVGIYYLSKQESVRAKVNEVVSKIKGKLSKKKDADVYELIEEEEEEELAE